MVIRNYASLLAVCLLSLLAFSAHAQRELAPAIDYPNESWVRTDGKQMSAEQVRQVIVKAVDVAKAERGYPWKLESNVDGKLVASTTIRGKHIVRVTITNTDTNFSVLYNSSVNMKANKNGDGVMIHPFYNRWVGELVKTIKDELARA